MASTTIANLRIPLEDVVKATNNFHHDNIIGHGDFGTAYKGQLLRSGNLINIAARKLDRKHRVGDVEFWNEVRVLSDLKHKNIVSLIGFCDEEHKIIITTYESNGSLEQFLDNSKLTWSQRLRICIGVASALSYLHYDEGRNYAIIHYFINSSTILLDEDWEAKLSGFEYSIKQSVNRRGHITLCDLVGATGYMDPEVEKTRGVTHKSDTYSFGVVLFEMLCGRKASIQNDGDTLLAPLVVHHYKNNTLKAIIHPDLFNQMSPKSLDKYLKVAYACLTEERARRPDTNDIVDELEKALEFHMRLENLGKNSETLMIPLRDIILATDNFSETHKIASWGSYTLYKAEFDHLKNNPSYVEGRNQGEHPKENNTVLIKRYLHDDDMYGEEFTANLEMLTSVKHRNIITLLGFCVDGSEMILVLENASKKYLYVYLGFMKLFKHIFTWEKRLRICVDVAHALCYLHYEMEDQKMIIHRDICSSSIVLDENWRAKIFDFGYAVFLPPNQEDEALYLSWRGRRSYVDPQYKKTNKLKRESDVYNFGVVLFEILCGRKANDPIYLRESDMGLAHVARQSIHKGMLEDMIDPRIKEETGDNNLVLDGGLNRDSLRIFIDIANQCVAKTQDQRPTMKVVVEELEKAFFQCVAETQDQRPTMKVVVEELENELFFREEFINRSNTDLVANKHEKLHLTCGILEGGTQCQDTDQDVDKNEKPWLARKTPEMDLEHSNIRLSDIKLATNNFSTTQEITFLNNDYRLYTAELNFFVKQHHSSMEENNNGEPPKGHNIVVIKRYPKGHDVYGKENFYKEIELLTSVKHSNIATLYGFCVEDFEMILVINGVSNGYLSQYLVNVNLMCHLTWEKRLKICIDVANALKYIHSEIEDGKMILNNDINIGNIGLDENWGAKIIDFADFVSLPSNPEDKARKSSDFDEISSVKTFGGILFVILCGITNYKRKWGILFGSVATPELYSETIQDIVDPLIMNETNESRFFLDKGPSMDSLNTFIEITRRCWADQDLCPTMEVVLKQLEEALLFEVKL